MKDIHEHLAQIDTERVHWKKWTEALETKLAEAYQIVGNLAHYAGCFEDPNVQLALDHLSNPMGHLSESLLPWPRTKLMKDPEGNA